MLVSNLEVSGSIKMHGGGITGSLLGTSSFSYSSSISVTASYLLGSSETSSYAITASFVDFPTGSESTVALTGSLTITGSLTVSGSTILTGSLEVTDGITGSFTGSATGEFSGSFTGSFRGVFSGSGANLKDISASVLVGDVKRLASGSATASISNVQGFVVNTKSTISGSLTVTGTVSASFSGSGADLYDISASAIKGLSLVSISTGSVTASVDQDLGLIVTSLESGSLFKGNVNIETGSLNAEYIYAGYPSGSGVSGSTATSGTNVFGTASWATNVVGGRFINTGSTNAVQAVTGSLIITQNLTVQGSSSFTYVTASQILIDQNTLTVFTSGSSLPNGGYKVADTSSWDGTGSFLNESSLLYNTVDKYWTLANGLIVSGTLQVSQSITASGFDGTASLAKTASFVNPLTQSVIVSGGLDLTGSITVHTPNILSQSYSSSVSESYDTGSATTGSTTLWATNSFSLPVSGANVFATSSWAVNAVSAAWAPGAGDASTASYAVEAYPKRFVTESEYHAIHTGHVALMSRVYNHGTYSINEGKGVYAVGTQSLTDNGRLEVEQFFNKGIFINSGDFENVPAVNEAGSSTGGGTAQTASYAVTASYLLNSGDAISTASFIITGSQGLTQTIQGTLVSTGSIRISGPTTGSGNTVLNTTTFNNAGSAISIVASVTASASVGENTRKMMLMSYGAVGGLFVNNFGYNMSSSVGLSAGFNQASMYVRTGSGFGILEFSTASVQISGSLPLLVSTNALFSGSQTTRSIQVENAVYLTGDKTGDEGHFRILGVTSPYSASIQFGISSSNSFSGTIEIGPSESFSSQAGGNYRSLKLEAPAFQFRQGFNTPFQVNPLGNIYMGSGNTGVGVNEGLAANQYAIQHTGLGSNLMLKHFSATSGQFFRIQNGFSFGLYNRLEIYNAGGTGVYLASGSTAWTATSDERLKDILYPIENAVEKVEGLRTVIGKYKTDGDHERRAFFIAQDVVAHFPEAAEMSNPEELGVNYTEISPLLAAAIKELSQENKELKAEIAEIKSQLSQLLN